MYTVDEVCRIVGVGRGTMHSWLARGHVPCASRGAGKARFFSREELLVIAMIAELVKAGFEISFASKRVLDVVRRVDCGSRITTGYDLEVQRNCVEGHVTLNS